MSKARKPRLTSASVADSGARWEAIDEFLKSTPSLKPLRAKLAKLLDELRGIADYGLAEQIEEVVNELGGEQLDRAVVWAFVQGRLAGLNESRQS